ncbi:general secretion pathway protein GspB [Vibrio lentus]|uniref:General secretion pathway protein GspA n=1 Tax=Vibrio lentus TaxID=136468 RepID=A0A2N7KB15_9VIBR|nr:general secretion pathway protein GspB [Vibrio lentus]PMM72206.1 general secretion pathway protein GspA [Vibrio lentus]
MSRIMQELKQSELRGYQSHHVPNSAVAISKKRGSSLAIGLLLLLVPSLLVGGALVYQSYTSPAQVLSQSTESMPPKPEDKTIASKAPVTNETVAVTQDESPFLIRTAPTSNELKALPRKEVYAQVNINGTADMDDSNAMLALADVSESSSELGSEPSLESFESSPTQSNSRDSSNELQSDRDLLQGLDLTELPPDLALKLESIMEDQQSAPEPMDSRPATSMESPVIELESHGSSLSGVLPKLDLQTHMYSSSETKRWVKVNGHEVAQGDWIGQDIQLLEIKPQSVIIEFNQQKIEIPALYEWKG